MSKFKGFFSVLFDDLKEKTKKIFYKPEPAKSHDVKHEHVKNLVQSHTKKMLSISEAAAINNVSRQAIYFAIKMNRLPAKKDGENWMITKEDLDTYTMTKYSRENSRLHGKLIFDKQKGFYSIREASEILGVDINRMYYLVRMGQVKGRREGAAIVINFSELQQYMELNPKKKKSA